MQTAENLSLYERIVNTVPGVIYIFDVRQKKHVFVNRGIADTLGYSPEKGALDGEFIRSLMHPADWQSFLDYLGRLANLKDGETAEFEYRMRHSSGAWCWFNSRDSVFTRNSDGSVRETIGTATDVTERKSAEEKTRFIADLNQALLPLADPEEIMAVAVRMLGEYLNVDRCGYAEVESDKDHFVVMGNYTRGSTPSIVGRYRLSDFSEREQKVLCGDQPYVVHDIAAESPAGADLSLYELGKIRSLVCVPLHKGGNFMARMAVHQSTPRRWSNDEIGLITKVANRCWESVERARAVRRLKESDERYRASEGRLRRITDATQDALWEIDLKTNQLWWSEGAKPLFGHSPGELQIGLEDWYRAIHPEDVARVRAEFERFMASESALWTDRYRFRRADGSYCYIDDRGRKFYDELGAPVLIAGAMVDITGREVAEEGLRESEERYRLLTELSPDGVVIAAPDGTIQLANPSMLRMLGVVLERVAGHNLFDFVAPEYWEHCRDCMKALMTTDSPATQVEAAFRREDGRSFPVEVSAVRFDWKGRPFAQIVIHDISGRKQAEYERERLSREIEAERDRLRQILQQMPIGVAIAEAPSGRILFHNLEATRLLRHPLLPSEDFKGYAQYGALHDDDTPYRPEEYPAVRSLISEQVIKGEETKYRRGDGTETFFSVDSAPIYDPEGRMVSVVATFFDIAERKRADRALRESEERFAKAFRASPDSLVISRLTDGVVLEINDSFVALCGYDRDEVIGHSTLGLGLYEDPSDRTHALAILKEQNHVRDFEMTLKRKSGELRLMTLSAEPLDLRGEHCWLTICRDITERRLVEQERERLLLQEKAARQEAEAANRMKDEFLATISHELRTPMTAILGWAHILADTSLPESQRRHALDVIERSAKSQGRLIDDILDTSRIITGRLKLDAHPVDMRQVFQAALDVIRPSAEAKRIHVRAVIDDTGSLVFGDASRLQQVIWNLLSNAVKFTSEDGRVQARLSRTGGQVEISISDNGMGIEPDFLPYVFDRFRQADSTSTRRYGGLGLGLAIVRHVVEMHGGSVFALSPGKGQGSTFEVRFPVISARLQQPESPPPEPERKEPDEQSRADPCQRLDGLGVLVVEDDADTLEMLRFILAQCGAKVVTAASTKEALEVLELWLPNALVSDLAMPGQDGYELIRKLRSRAPERGGNIPAILLTAYARAEDRTRALAAGFQMHLPKPVDPEYLVAVVAKLTGHNHPPSASV